MSLLIVLTLILNAALVESSDGVSGYLGDNVTLPSGAKSSHLSTIEWSIFSNTTWIATYRNGRKNVDRLDRYKGRLTLNTTSGDLTVHSLTAEDAMEYSVFLVPNEQGNKRKIYLTVRERLQKPTIEITLYPGPNGTCFMELNCSSPHVDVEFSWQFKPHGMTTFQKSGHGNNSRLVHLRPEQKLVEITCISTREMETTSDVITQGCAEGTSELRSQPQRCREGFFFLMGVIVTFVVSILICCFKDRIKATCDSIKERFSKGPSESHANKDSSVP